MTPKIRAEKISLAKKLKSKNSNLDKWKCENVWNVRSKSIEFLSCLWAKNRGKVTAFRDAGLVFSPLSLSYKLSLFLLIADFTMRTSWMQMRDARRCGKLTDYTDCSKSGAVCPKRFSKELFSFGKSWTGNARPCDILSGRRLGKPCYHFPRTHCDLDEIAIVTMQWWERKLQLQIPCMNGENTKNKDTLTSSKIG